jgi:hypothetical protein
MAESITATIVPGQGNAAANHRRLIPRIAKHFPEVSWCSEFGTINVQLDRPLDRSHADFWTPHIPWIPAYLSGADRAQRLEAFGFIRVALECPLGGARYAAWIILPEGADLTYCSDRAEIIAGELIADVANGARCAVHIDHKPAIAAPAWFGEIYGKSLATNSNSASGVQA